MSRISLITFCILSCKIRIRDNFPVLPDTTELRFEHSGSHKQYTIQRKQVPIEPGFTVTVHKVQGQTMKRVVVDLEG